MIWPPEWVDAERFAAWVAERSGGEDLAAERRDDLYLACACASGTPAAISAFEVRHFGEVDRALARMQTVGLSNDELRQRLRLKLFVGDADHPPAISAYAGRGNLGAWFRAMATRVVLDHLGSDHERPVDDALFDALATMEDGAETSHLREVYRTELRASFAEAAARLTDHERNLLRYAFVDELGIDALAAVYKIHRATAARRLSSARESLGKHLREVLTERLRVSDVELVSIMRLVLSSVDLTMARYFGPRR